MHIYTNSTTAWTAMLAAMERATVCIYVEMYIFSEDTQETHDFVATLVDRARSGVQVVLILDAFGSIGLAKSTLTKLRDAGVEVRFFRHWIHRTHRKTVIVDNKLAFIGGVNITRHARAWNDLQLRVTGAIVARLVKVFSRTYKLSGGTQHLRVKAAYTKRAHRIRMWILDHTPHAGVFKLKSYYLTKLATARERITFVTPYFVPHQWLLDAIAGAIGRGISVELLVPEKTDSIFLDAINRYYIGRVLAVGASVFVTPGTTHAKAVLIDETEGLIGSGNIDSLSFERNSELGIFFTEPQAVRSLARIISAWKERANILDHTDTYRLPWYYRPLVLIIKALHPFL